MRPNPQLRVGLSSSITGAVTVMAAPKSCSGAAIQGDEHTRSEPRATRARGEAPAFACASAASAHCEGRRRQMLDDPNSHCLLHRLDKVLRGLCCEHGDLTRGRRLTSAGEAFTSIGRKQRLDRCAIVTCALSQPSTSDIRPLRVEDVSKLSSCVVRIDTGIEMAMQMGPPACAGRVCCGREHDSTETPRELRGNQRQSEAIRGNQRQSEATRDKL